MRESYNLVTILGPTATGKTKLAVYLAGEFYGEIISADSRQVYIGMDIGTGKDLSDYVINGNKIEYYLIDIISPFDEFNLFLFNKEFYEAFGKIKDKNKLPFLTGGTGLYLSSVLQNYHLIRADLSESQKEKLESFDINYLRKLLSGINPATHNTTDLLDKERIIKAIIVANAKNKDDELIKPVIHSLNIGIMPDRELIKKRITERLIYRLKNGMIEEVESLVKNGISYEKLNFFGLEYKYAGLFLKGELSYNDMFQKLNSSIHKFAKRQITWFRKMEKEGVKINWLNSPDPIAAGKIIKEQVLNED